MRWEWIVVVCVAMVCITYVIITWMTLRAMRKLDERAVRPMHILPQPRIGRGRTTYPTKSADGRKKENGNG